MSTEEEESVTAGPTAGEPVWPSGKALLRLSGKRKDLGSTYRFGSPFSSKRLWFVDTVL